MFDGTMMLICFAMVARELPAIIWSIRCPADSPNYKLPHSARSLLNRRR
ncbi:hypothetical protein [Sphingosinicella sp.]